MIVISFEFEWIWLFYMGIAIYITLIVFSLQLVPKCYQLWELQSDNWHKIRKNARPYWRPFFVIYREIVIRYPKLYFKIYLRKPKPLFLDSEDEDELGDYLE